MQHPANVNKVINPAVQIPQIKKKKKKKKMGIKRGRDVMSARGRVFDASVCSPVYPNVCFNYFAIYTCWLVDETTVEKLRFANPFVFFFFCTN